jgi:L-malate glycosyltransferase
MHHDLTVMLTTYNRARDLRRTLEGFAGTDRTDCNIEFVVVDNGSSDDTRAVIESFANKINIKYIFEPRNGKNVALNAALDSVRLGDVVVFTDDDVDVPRDWLTSIRSVCDRWPEYMIFGGRIEVVYPTLDLPAWVDDHTVGMLAFARHDYADHECEYHGYNNPYGPNYWVRKEIFDRGYRYNESIGPKTKNRMMGSETSFFVTLIKDGYKFIYAPSVCVGHRIREDVLHFFKVWKRGYRCGRGELYIFGLPYAALLKKHPLIWRCRQYGAIVWCALKLMIAIVRSSGRMRLGRSVVFVNRISYYREALRAAGRGINPDR